MSHDPRFRQSPVNLAIIAGVSRHRVIYDLDYRSTLELGVMAEALSRAWKAVFADVQLAEDRDIAAKIIEAGARPNDETMETEAKGMEENGE